MDIEKLDKNFAVTDKIDRDQIEYIDALNFDLYGAILDNGNYRRMPEEVAKSVSQNVYWINHCLADGRIRFATDSPYVAVCAYCNTIGRMLHFPMTGSAGMDLYSGKRYFGTFIPNIDENNSFSAVIDLDGKMRDYTINLPLYTGIDKLYIGLKKGCKIKKIT